MEFIFRVLLSVFWGWIVYCIGEGEPGYSEFWCWVGFLVGLTIIWVVGSDVDDLVGGIAETVADAFDDVFDD